MVKSSGKKGGFIEKLEKPFHSLCLANFKQKKLLTLLLNNKCLFLCCNLAALMLNYSKNLLIFLLNLSLGLKFG